MLRQRWPTRRPSHGDHRAVKDYLIRVLIGIDQMSVLGWLALMRSRIGIAACLALAAGSAYGQARWFGYYDGALQGDPVNVRIAAQHGNIVFIGSSRELPASLGAAADAGVKAIASVQGVFFGGSGAPLPSGSSWYRARRAIARYRDTVVAVYLYDEPYWSKPKWMHDTRMRANLAAAAAKIHDAFPALPVAVIFGWPSVNSGLRVPRGVNWLGVDCYNGWQYCGYSNPATGLHQSSVPTMLDILQQRIAAINATGAQPPERMLLVPPATRYVPGGLSTDAVLGLAQRYRDYAAAHDNVIAVLPFIWQSTAQGSGEWIGASQLPAVASFYADWRSAVTGGSGAPPVQQRQPRIPDPGPTIQCGTACLIITDRDGNILTGGAVGRAFCNGGIWIFAATARGYVSGGIELGVANCN